MFCYEIKMNARCLPFSGRHAKNKARPPEISGRRTLCCCGFPAYFTNRYRITANWARLAVPAGFSVPCAVPPTISFFTDHAMASLA